MPKPATPATPPVQLPSSGGSFVLKDGVPVPETPPAPQTAPEPVKEA